MASALKVVLLVVVATVAFSEAGLPPRYLRERLLYPTTITTACGITVVSGEGAATPTPAADGQATLFSLRCKDGCTTIRDSDAGTKTISGGRNGVARFTCSGDDEEVTDMNRVEVPDEYSYRKYGAANLAWTECASSGGLKHNFYCTPKDQVIRRNSQY